MSEFTLIEAAGHKPKVAGIAYSGGSMNLPGWKHPVVVDLAGMEIPESVPLLTNHENSAASVVVLFARRFSWAVASFPGSTCGNPSQNQVCLSGVKGSMAVNRYSRNHTSKIRFSTSDSQKDRSTRIDLW